MKRLLKDRIKRVHETQSEFKPVDDKINDVEKEVKIQEDAETAKLIRNLYHVEWDEEAYGEVEPKNVGLDFFSVDNGFTEADVKAIKNLQPGQTINDQSGMGDVSITLLTDEEKKNIKEELTVDQAKELYKKHGMLFLDDEEGKEAYDALYNAGFTMKKNQAGDVAHCIELNRLTEEETETELEIANVQKEQAGIESLLKVIDEALTDADPDFKEIDDKIDDVEIKVNVKEDVADDLADGDYKGAVKGKEAEFLQQEFDNAFRGGKIPAIETSNGVLYLEPKGTKIIVGGLTNGGVIPSYEFDYDFTRSLDWNLQGIIDEVLAEEGYPDMDESVKSKRIRRK